jgi:hypothetical protein
VVLGAEREAGYALVGVGPAVGANCPRVAHAVTARLCRSLTATAAEYVPIGAVDGLLVVGGSRITVEAAVPLTKNSCGWTAIRKSERWKGGTRAVAGESQS